MSPANARRLDLVPEPDEDAEAEALMQAAFASARERARRECARVILERIRPFPQTDEDGTLLRGEDGKATLGPLTLFFRRLNAETVQDLRTKHTHRVQVRRSGALAYERQTDEQAFSDEYVYLSLLPWCRTRYFEDQRRWGDEPVGTGQEFFFHFLTQGEIVRCRAAINQLEGMESEEVEELGKDSAPEPTPS